MSIFSKVGSAAKSVVKKVTGGGSSSSLGNVYVTQSEGQGKSSSAFGGQGVVVGGTTQRDTSGGYVGGGGGVNVTISKGSSGGGGGSSGGGGGGTTNQSNTPLATYDAAKDIPKVPPPSYSGVISPTKSTSGFNYAKDILQEDLSPQGIFKAGKAVVVGVGAGVKNALAQRNADKEVKLQQDAQNRLYRTNVEPSKTGMSGTGIVTRTEVPTQELIRDASLGDQTALVALSMRFQQDYNAKASQKEMTERANDVKQLSGYVSNVQAQIDSGNISLKEGQKQVDDYAASLDTSRQQRVADALAPVGEIYQKNLDSIANTGQLSRIVLTTAESAALGFGTGAVLSALPAASAGTGIVKTAAAIGTTGLITYEGQKLATNVATGKAGAIEVAGFVAPLTGFIIGAGLYGKVAGAGTRAATDIKLQTALDSTNVKISNIKGLTTESQIKALHLPESEEGRLLGELKAGRRITITDYKLDTLNPQQRAIIEKAYPNLKLQSFEVTDNVGNTIRTKNLLKVENAQGNKIYKDFTAGSGEGVYNPETKTATIDTTYLRGQEGKLPSEVFKERTVVKVEKNLKTPTDIIRATQSKSLTFEGLKVRATSGKPITFKDLTEVAQSENFGRFPSRKGTISEVSQLKEINIGQSDVLMNDEILFSLRGVGKTFEIKAGRGKIENIPKPIEFKMSKAMKPFEEPVSEINFNAVEPKSISTPQQLKSPIAEEFNLKNLPSTDFSKQIEQNLKSTAKKLNLKPPKQEVVNLGELWSGGSNKDLDKLIQDTNKKAGVLDVTKLRKKLTGAVGGKIPVVKVKPATKPKQTPLVIQTPAQVQKQLQKLQQVPMQTPRLIPPSIIVPRIEVPKIPIPKIPFPSFKQGAGIRKIKKQSKRAFKSPYGYAASLAAAAAQESPIKVTPAQFKRLVAKEKFTALPVLEITDEKQIKKKLTQVDFGNI